MRLLVLFYNSEEKAMKLALEDNAILKKIGMKCSNF
jgi:hypothetical protein